MILSSQAIPKDLREQMIERLSTMPESEILEFYQLLLFAEKDRLWKEIQDDAQAEQSAGMLDHIPELVRRYRDERKSA